MVWDLLYADGLVVTTETEASEVQGLARVPEYKESDELHARSSPGEE